MISRASKRDSWQAWRRAGGGLLDVNDLAKLGISIPSSQIILTIRGVERAMPQILRRSSLGRVGNRRNSLVDIVASRFS